MWRDDEKRKRERWGHRGKRREDETSERDRRMVVHDDEEEVEKKRSRNSWTRQKKTVREGAKGEHKCRKSRRKLSNKDVSYFYILREETEGYSEWGLWYYYSVCYCSKCYYHGVYGAEGESSPQKEHVCVKTCTLLDGQIWSVVYFPRKGLFHWTA